MWPIQVVWNGKGGNESGAFLRDSIESSDIQLLKSGESLSDHTIPPDSDQVEAKVGDLMSLVLQMRRKEREILRVAFVAQLRFDL